VVAVSGQYCTVEEYVDAKYDLHIFKLGNRYRAMIASHCCDCRRKSLSGNWKTSAGQSILVEVPVQDKYRLWIDQVSEMFGGLDICSLEAVVAKDGQEVIIEVNDCALNLMGESQEEDRRQIAEMVLKEMETRCLPAHTNGHIGDSETSSAGESASKERKERKNLPGPVQRGPGNRVGSYQGSNDSTNSASSKHSMKASTDVDEEEKERKSKNLPGPIQRGPQRRRSTSQAASTGSASSDSSTTSNNSADSVKEAVGQPAEGEDTMKNLRTTFAGIFGESRLK